mmetsp:Transcript_96540/g.272998  ORF Transcript_96540/g.272998 Transcript_96540/m.272998 type:complete len:97 (+) Transcript_96540:174-464(+)
MAPSPCQPEPQQQPFSFFLEESFFLEDFFRSLSSIAPFSAEVAAGTSPLAAAVVGAEISATLDVATGAATLAEAAAGATSTAGAVEAATKELGDST